MNEAASADRGTERWKCLDCDHETEAPRRVLAGRWVKTWVEGLDGVRMAIRITVCPDCYSENWHSESVYRFMR